MGRSSLIIRKSLEKEIHHRPNGGRRRPWWGFPRRRPWRGFPRRRPWWRFPRRPWWRFPRRRLWWGFPKIVIIRGGTGRTPTHRRKGISWSESPSVACKIARCIGEGESPVANRRRWPVRSLEANRLRERSSEMPQSWERSLEVSRGRQRSWKRIADPLRTRPRLRWMTRLWAWWRTWAWRRGSRSWRSFIWARRDRRSWRIPTATEGEASLQHRCSPNHHNG